MAKHRKQFDDHYEPGEHGPQPRPHPLMQYLPPVQKAPQQGQAPAGGAEKYHGPIAEGYDAKRENDPKWIVEQRVIEGMLSELPKGSVVLDCPVGTGRFLDFYQKQGLLFVGVDLSPDMLVQSALKVMPQEAVEQWVAECNAKNAFLNLNIKDKGALIAGDVRKLGMEDKSVDAAVACRITRWLSPEENILMMRELQRVARKRIIITARVAHHMHARTLELFESALDGWRVARNEAGYILDYRIICFEPI